MDLFVVLVGLVLSVPAAYVLGWTFSRGYHRGKREFLARIRKEHCE